MKNKTCRNLSFLLIILSSIMINSCAKKRIATLNNTETRLASKISSQEAFELIKNNLNNNDFIILDVRTSKEYISGHLDRSKMLDFNSQTFKDDLRGLDKNKTYLIYCRSGNRSGQAFSLMREMGFMRFYEIKGGITDWINNKLPAVNK